MEEQKTYSYEEGKAIFTKRMIVYFIASFGILGLAIALILAVTLLDFAKGLNWPGFLRAIIVVPTLIPPGLVFLAKALTNRRALKTLKMVCEPLLQ